MVEEIRAVWRQQLFAGEGGAAGAAAGSGGGEGQAQGESVEGAGDDGRQTLRDLGVPEAVLERSSVGIIIFNPGSLTFPKGPYPEHTMGIIDEDAGTVMLTDIFGKTLSSLKIRE